MNRILEIGFKYAGYWEMSSEGLDFKLKYHSGSKNILYAFVSNGQIKYVGKTLQPLSKRFYGYKNPHSKQSTNIKNHSLICNSLTSDCPVDVFVLPDNGLLYYGGFHINLAAGLEDSIIQQLDPEWNGKQEALVVESPRKKKESVSNKPLLNIAHYDVRFDLKLGVAYYNQGFINIPAKYSELVSSNGEEIEIFTGSVNNPILGYINRTAQKNQTPRIMGGTKLRGYIQSKFKQGQIVSVRLLSSNSLRIEMPKTT